MSSTLLPWLCCLVDGLVAYLAIRRTTAVSPLSIFCIFNTACLAYFVLLVGERVTPSQYLSAMPYFGLRPYMLRTSAIFALLNLMAVPVIYSVPQIKDANFTELQNRLRFLLSPQAINAILAIFALLTFAHAVDIDLGYMWRYQGYMTLRNNDIVGISNPLAALYQKVGTLVGAACFGIAALCHHSKRHKLVPLALLIGTYGLLYTLAAASRSLTLIFILPAAVRFFFKKKIDIPLITMAALSVISILYALKARGQPELGLVHVPDALCAIEFKELSGSILSLLSNIAQGGLVLANSIRIDSSFEFSYKAKSLLSPLPGALDGWPHTLATYQHRITGANPMGSFSEAWLFGGIWFLGLFAGTMYLLRAVVMQMFFRASLFTVPLYGLTLLLIYRLHHYPARISQRIMLLIIVMLIADVLFARWQARQQLRERRRRRALQRRLPTFRSPRPSQISTAHGK
ncbi:hypothetical protein [Novosphingobium sp. MBES04]|uniref:hypothetical protein n=1 Tax=Novosphingobium sp. MBES04 TaxID=1206458 RepID=UPI00057E45CE|nr:hypothetical protein [Novosphingobium sp. MBES04]